MCRRSNCCKKRDKNLKGTLGYLSKNYLPLKKLRGTLVFPSHICKVPWGTSQIPSVNETLAILKCFRPILVQNVFQHPSLNISSLYSPSGPACSLSSTLSTVQYVRERRYNSLVKLLRAHLLRLSPGSSKEDRSPTVKSTR